MNSKIKERLMFLLGVAICFGVAALSVFLEEQIPGGLLGASIIALFMGTIINSFFHPKWIQPALKFSSKKILKGAIILLGASLSVSTILSVGKLTFFVMIFTFAMCLVAAISSASCLASTGSSVISSLQAPAFAAALQWQPSHR